MDKFIMVIRMFYYRVQVLSVVNTCHIGCELSCRMSYTYQGGASYNSMPIRMIKCQLTCSS
nr:hyp [Cotesia vestalis bracovirus]